MKGARDAAKTARGPWLWIACACLGATACSAPGGPHRAHDPWGQPSADGGADGALAARCDPARSSQPLPARTDLFSAGATAGGPTVMFTQDLFNLFRSNCGACHVETRLGEFQVTLQTFVTSPIVKDMVLGRIQSADPSTIMPPGSPPYAQRQAADPIVELATLLRQWIDQGRPADAFTVAGPAQAGASPYVLSDQLIDAMTNIGNCVPDARLVGANGSKMDKMDAFFAQATELPDSLADTDLDTLDAAALARAGMVAYVPTYPLWTDDAGKLRYIRVPKGQSVKFDKATQSFQIPPNTRFYKTFLRQVVDANGYRSWRKIETRVIVARPDTTQADGTAKTTALFGTYVWNDDETEAHLLRDPLRNGQPFRDRLISLVVDEPRAQAVRDSHPPDLDYALEVQNTGIVRHYALPGSERCIQCHMGSPTASFSLGFLPLQLARRAEGEGGIYESVGADEMTQLQRFIDYGLVTGMASPADVTPLEASQGARKPRNEYELKAQAYMLGNCAHCHNPRGYPSVKNPELKDALDFLPSPGGGIFQFPLDRVSPLRKRGPNLDVPIPYITPSLRDIPEASASTPNWTPKWVDCTVASYPVCTFFGMAGFYSAPWRSLIYRNVDTPFMYADDFAIFPHMPMNAPGFDCRAPRIMGEWMVSIPARQVGNISEDLVLVNGPVDMTPQPYQEGKPGDPDYENLKYWTDMRMAQYRMGGRYDFCPDTHDIVDYAVLNRQKRNDPLVPAAEAVYDPKDPSQLLEPDLGVPVRAHWVVTDLTDVPGDWTPRRPDWKDVLVDQMFPDIGLSAEELAAQKQLVADLQTVTLTPEIRSYALTELPYGLWQTKPGCDLSGQKKGADFTGADRPVWMDKVHVDPGAPVYMQAPGAAIFSTVCINCHGPQADSHGLLSDAIQLMTGGDARVANLRDGLFGPTSQPGGNRQSVFGPFAPTGVTADDLGARYLSWMTLGGTQRVLPGALLNIVAATRVLGAQRPANQITPNGSPNMLKLAQELCRHVLPAVDLEYELGDVFNNGRLNWGVQTGLIDTNEDAEMWQHLCSLFNRAVVRVPYIPRWTAETGKGEPGPKLIPAESLYWADAYPPGAAVLDHRGRTVSGVHADNLFPMCIRKPADPAQAAAADKFLAAQPVPVPYCPPQLFATGSDGTETWKLASAPDPLRPGQSVLVDAPKWATRGAINAGLSVFVYLDAIERGATKPKPAFNKCEQL